ncbi:putative aTP-binding cassette transporter [Burkholderia pseudomallei MSHR332]|nr:putative aTP-binding cassette transporter [Burkholderia pseudomallei MSHR332]
MPLRARAARRPRESAGARPWPPSGPVPVPVAAHGRAAQTREPGADRSRIEHGQSADDARVKIRRAHSSSRQRKRRTHPRLAGASQPKRRSDSLIDPCSADDRCHRASRRPALDRFPPRRETRAAPDSRAAQALPRRVRDRARRLRAERRVERAARRDAKPRALRAASRRRVARVALRPVRGDRARHPDRHRRAVRAAVAGHDGATARARRAARRGGRAAGRRADRRGARAVGADRRRDQRVDAVLRAAQSRDARLDRVRLPRLSGVAVVARVPARGRRDPRRLARLSRGRQARDRLARGRGPLAGQAVRLSRRALFRREGAQAASGAFAPVRRRPARRGDRRGARPPPPRVQRVCDRRRLDRVPVLRVPGRRGVLARARRARRRARGVRLRRRVPVHAAAARRPAQQRADAERGARVARAHREADGAVRRAAHRAAAGRKRVARAVRHARAARRHAFVFPRARRADVPRRADRPDAQAGRARVHRRRQRQRQDDAREGAHGPVRARGRRHRARRQADRPCRARRVPRALLGGVQRFPSVRRAARHRRSERRGARAGRRARERARREALARSQGAGRRRRVLHARAVDRAAQAARARRRVSGGPAALPVRRMGGRPGPRVQGGVLRTASAGAARARQDGDRDQPRRSLLPDRGPGAEARQRDHRQRDVRRAARGARERHRGVIRSPNAIERDRSRWGMAASPP